jgi:hypothetical protein
MSWTKRGVALALTLLFAVSTSVVLGAPQQQTSQQQGPATVDSRAGRATLTLVGNCVKIGVKDTGSLGVGSNTNPGIQYDDTCTGTFNDAYDFLTPGIPYEGISVNVDGTNYYDNNTGTSQINTAPSIQDKSGVAYRGTTYDKRVVQMSENLKFKMENDIRFNNNSKFIEITTYITATDAIAELYIGRFIDSDAVVKTGDTSNTNNALGYSTISPKRIAKLWN